MMNRIRNSIYNICMSFSCISVDFTSNMFNRSIANDIDSEIINDIDSEIINDIDSEIINDYNQYSFDDYNRSEIEEVLDMTFKADVDDKIIARIVIIKPITNLCSICLDYINNDSETLKCNHIYHRSCINRWLEINNTCPYCRECVVNINFNEYPLNTQIAVLNNVIFL
jgi:hypothetical protein